jgi:hypothetical protein
MLRRFQAIRAGMPEICGTRGAMYAERSVEGCQKRMRGEQSSNK